MRRKWFAPPSGGYYGKGRNGKPLTRQGLPPKIPATDEGVRHMESTEKPHSVSREAAILAAAKVIDPLAWKGVWMNPELQAYAQERALALSTDIISAAIPHLVGQPIGYAIEREIQHWGTAAEVREIVAEIAAAPGEDGVGLIVVAVIPVEDMP